MSERKKFIEEKTINKIYLSLSDSEKLSEIAYAEGTKIAYMNMIPHLTQEGQEIYKGELERIDKILWNLMNEKP